MRTQSPTPRYDAIGDGYAKTRREDPNIAKRIHEALGKAQTIVNVGAGAGSYEPKGKHIIAIEPSEVMAEQRPGGLAPAIIASAGKLPLLDESVDGGMAILTVHHWDEEQERGVRELRRVARGSVVILTIDPSVSEKMWLMRDYLPEVAELDRNIFPSMERVQGWLCDNTTVEKVPISRDSPDWTLLSFWAHPERVLDARARSATSGFARMGTAVIERVVSEVRRDLKDGSWDRRYGELRELEEFDAGLRLVISARPLREP